MKEIPKGMRDLSVSECLKKDALKKRLEKVYRSYGYSPIETPLIEYYDTYASTFTTLKEAQMYRFLDDDGQVLALRTDMTLPIARLVATKYIRSNPPFRFRYCANVYKVRQKFAGKQNEATDCGIECIGVKEQGDIEVLMCAMDALEALEAGPYTLEIGDPRLFRKAALLACLTEEQIAHLADLTDRKSMPALYEYLASLDLDRAQRTFFAKLPLCSGKTALEEMKQYCFDDSLAELLKSLEELNSTLQALGYEHIGFDLGKIPHLDYYTGIIFEGYVESVGTSVLSGGRYDSLLKKLGRDLPACGFGIKLDALLERLPEETVNPVSLRIGENRIEALKKAKEMRQTQDVVLVYEEDV